MLPYIVSLSFILLSAAFTIWRIDKSRKRESEAYNQVICSLLADKRDLLDRFFMSKGYLPTGIDVQEQAKEKLAQKASENGQKSGLPRAMNPVDKARNDAIAKEAEKLDR